MTKLTFKAVKAELKAIDMTISKRDDEYRVNFKDGKEATASYSDDLQDSRDTAIAMRKHWDEHNK